MAESFDAVLAEMHDTATRSGALLTYSGFARTMHSYADRLAAAHAAEVEALKESLDGKRHEANAAWVAAEAAERDASAKQARIDALMLEYCPDEMTPEQVAEWAQHQAVAATEQAGERENGTEV